ncbi:hypothetical protein [Mesorhizobium sp. M4B.F.Ca.ET.058.02.1.1]|uniref:hypothetical protein n=1 Tax=Mesorhizobium sp. M4B.F.Ca.ET.058.02.1.1 TaxID=2493675 RepID=UPI000F756323|nr:hypothetical protein [Mesorhizobium sp. M4B.F.Ca.ET.058.02.1.1]AZO48079.1 hypothetical protein EJ073_09805 [Mesorhizobium sp. M4B.F.Ca.ET.058.02.1.1]
MIIDKLGDYRTRDGRKANIFGFNDNDVTFPVRGAVYKMYRGKERPRGYFIWMKDGRSRALGESGLDLVDFIG